MPMGKIVLLIIFAYYSFLPSILAQGESPETIAKWREFVQSLSGTQRKEFDRLHQEAGKMDPAELARKVEQFKASLDSQQRRTYEEIQQRGGGTAGGGRTPSSRNEGNGDEWEKPPKKTQGQQGVPPSSGGGGGFSGFDRWINNPELSESTRSSLARIKEIFARTGMDPVEKCEKIQHILQGIGTGDKRRIQIPSELVNFDCAREGQKGAENLMAAALTKGRRGGRK